MTGSMTTPPLPELTVDEAASLLNVTPQHAGRLVEACEMQLTLESVADISSRRAAAEADVADVLRRANTAEVQQLEDDVLRSLRSL